jgi:hypothetical protein
MEWVAVRPYRDGDAKCLVRIFFAAVRELACLWYDEDQVLAWAEGDMYMVGDISLLACSSEIRISISALHAAVLREAQHIAGLWSSMRLISRRGSQHGTRLSSSSAMCLL